MPSRVKPLKSARKASSITDRDDDRVCTGFLNQDRFDICRMVTYLKAGLTIVPETGFTICPPKFEALARGLQPATTRAKCGQRDILGRPQ